MYHQTPQKSLNNPYFIKCKQCGFSKDYNLHYFSLGKLKTWENTANKGKCFRALQTVLSRTLDYLSRKLFDSEITGLWFCLTDTKAHSK